MNALAAQVPGFLCFDHVAIAVVPGELEAHVRAYEALGFTDLFADVDPENPASVWVAEAAGLRLRLR